ncbi:MAG: hypothetical protein N2109_13605 [Fimbriimonadales bacterium]|nr:hypothetical protein [Fimbriimonadales bacterium]
MTEALKELVAELREWREANRQRDLQLEDAVNALIDEADALRHAASSAAFPEEPIRRLESVAERLGETASALASCVDSLKASAEARAEDSAQELPKLDPLEYRVVQELYAGPAGEAIRGMPLGRQVDLVEQVVVLHVPRAHL